MKEFMWCRWTCNGIKLEILDLLPLVAVQYVLNHSRCTGFRRDLDSTEVQEQIRIKGSFFLRPI